MKRNPKPEILQNLKIFECFHNAKKKSFFSNFREYFDFRFFQYKRLNCSSLCLSIPKYKIASTSKSQHKDESICTEQVRAKGKRDLFKRTVR